MKSKARKKSRGEESVQRKDDSVSALKGPSRLQKKQMKRVRFLTKLEKDGQVLSTRTTELKKKKGNSRRGKKSLQFSSLSSLVDNLPSFDSNPRSAFARQGKTRHRRSSQRVVLNETKQLAAVLSHPEYQENPFQAIHRHLSNTLPLEQDVKEEAAPKGRKNSKSRLRTASTQQMEE